MRGRGEQASATEVWMSLCGCPGAGEADFPESWGLEVRSRPADSASGESPAGAQAAPPRGRRGRALPPLGGATLTTRRLPEASPANARAPGVRLQHLGLGGTAGRPGAVLLRTPPRPAAGAASRPPRARPSRGTEAGPQPRAVGGLHLRVRSAALAVVLGAGAGGRHAGAAGGGGVRLAGPAGFGAAERTPGGGVSGSARASGPRGRGTGRAGGRAGRRRRGRAPTTPRRRAPRAGPSHPREAVPTSP